MALLSIERLCVRFQTPDGTVHAVNDVSFEIEAGKKLAMVGESGSGKTQIAFALMGLLANNGRAEGNVRFEETSILNAPQSVLNTIRSKRISIIFQDPMTSLHPYLTIADQMSEVLQVHEGISRAAAVAQSVRMLDAVRISDGKNRLRQYPHEFSGGMRQRIVIAMALLCRPQLIIADEPTTALDVTVQAQIMALLNDLQREFNSSILLITHDLGIVAGFCDDAMVLYGGQIMEKAPVRQLFSDPSHPYTQGLLAALPSLTQGKGQLKAIPGSPPDMRRAPACCPYAERCDFAFDRCHSELPGLSAEPPVRACFYPIEKLRRS